MRLETKPLILVVKDEAELAGVTTAHLEGAGMLVQSRSHGSFLRRNFANLMLLDVNLPD